MSLPRRNSKSWPRPTFTRKTSNLQPTCVLLQYSLSGGAQHSLSTSFLFLEQGFPSPVTHWCQPMASQTRKRSSRTLANSALPPLGVQLNLYFHIQPKCVSTPFPLMQCANSTCGHLQPKPISPLFHSKFLNGEIILNRNPGIVTTFFLFDLQQVLLYITKKTKAYRSQRQNPYPHEGLSTKDKVLVNSA